MKVTLPDKVNGVRETLFVLEVEFPVASAERTVEVEATGPIEPLDLSGSSRGGTYRIPVGLERLHVPMRVLEEGAAEARVTVRCTDGPEEGQSEERTLPIHATATKSGKGWGRWAAAAALLAVIGGGAWGLNKFVFSKKKAVPNVRSMTQAEAEAALDRQGLVAKIKLESAPTPDDENVVIRTDPIAGAPIPDNGIVEVVIGRGGDQYAAVPLQVGADGDAAEQALRAAHYQVVVHYQDTADPDKVGKVLSQAPEGGALPPRSQVEIWVGRALGGETTTASKVQVPAVVNRSQATAEVLLRRAGFEFEVHEQVVTNPKQDGRVLAQRPVQGSRAPKGSPVVLTVARMRPEDGQPATPPSVPPVEPPSVPPVEPPAVPPVAPPAVPPVAPPAVPPIPLPAVPPVEPPAVPPIEPPGVAPVDPPVEPATPPPPPPPGPTQPVTRPVDLVADAEGRVVLPDMKGWDRDAAEEKLEAAELIPIVMLEPTPDRELVGRVLRQRPPAGRQVERRAMIYVSIGERQAEAPLQPATEPLPARPDVPEPPTVPVEPPTQPPVRPVTPVEPPVHRPPVEPSPPVEPPTRAHQVPVPDVVGAKRARAEDIIRRAGFQVRVVLETERYPAAGTVVAQHPAPGDLLEAGAEVVLTAIQAPTARSATEAAVPDVIGLDRITAITRLREAGFRVNVTLGGGTRQEHDTVVDQSPPVTQVAPRYSWVEIVVARGTGPRKTATGGPPSLGPSRTPLPARPAESSVLEGPPAVGRGVVRLPPATPRGNAPLPPVQLPPRSAPKTASVPSVAGLEVHQAITQVLGAGLIPIIDVDRHATEAPGAILSQMPDGGAAALPGDLVRLRVSVGGTGTERKVNLPMAVGAEVRRVARMFSSTRAAVDVVEVRVSQPHPYAGTGRVAAQYPVQSVPMSQARSVTLWVVVP